MINVDNILYENNAADISIKTVKTTLFSEGTYMAKLVVQAGEPEITRLSRLMLEAVQIGGVSDIRFEEQGDSVMAEFLFYINADSEEEVFEILGRAVTKAKDGIAAEKR